MGGNNIPPLGDHQHQEEPQQDQGVPGQVLGEDQQPEHLQEANDNDAIWGSAGEGYTPLTDLLAATNGNGDGGVMVTFGPPSSSANDQGDSDDGYESDSDDIDGTGDHTFQYHQGAFFVNPAAFGPTSNDDDDDDDNNNDSNDQQNVTGALPEETVDKQDEIDFLALANQALLSLDDEYQCTLRGERRPPRWEEENEPSPSQTPNNGDSHATTPMPTNITAATADAATKGVDNNNDDDDDWKNLVAVAIDENLEQRHKAEFHAEWEQAPIVTRSGNAAKDMPHVDTMAVQRAIQAISLQKEASPFQQKFAQWQEKQQQSTQPSSLQHDLIPPNPLKAFQKSTPKAIQATHALSRSATIAEALVRLEQGGSLSFCHTSSVPGESMDKNNNNNNNTNNKDLTTNSTNLTIHIVGVDHVECASIERIQMTFRPLIQWILLLQDNNNEEVSSSPRPSPFLALQQVHLVLIGRDLVLPTTTQVDLLPPSPFKKDNTMTSSSSSSSSSSPRLQSAFATCHNGVYHEWLGLQDEETQGTNLQQPQQQKPDLIIAFNAGIWGYQEWQPTIDWLSRWAVATTMIITAYTLPEAQEDCEVIEKATMADTTAGSKSDRKLHDDTATSSCTQVGDETAIRRRRQPWCKMIWEPEQNPFGSKVIRDTQSKEKYQNPDIRRVEYHENGAWQAWRFGGPEDNDEQEKR